MARTADYTIQGFLYQFNKTLLEVLNASDDAKITIEGIDEDIEVAAPKATKAIQCKYHEAQQNFALSSIYKPVLQMLCHFHKNQDRKIAYKLYAYFPNQEAGTKFPLGRDQLEAITKSKNLSLKSYIDDLLGEVAFDRFLERFSFEFGRTLDEIKNDLINEFALIGYTKDDIETLIYPNAIQLIAEISTRHKVAMRTVTRADFLENLGKIKTTAISHWTLSLRTHKKVLEARKKQLKSNLNKNARLRYFLIAGGTIDDFSDGVVIFISEYLDKYHHKVAHNQTPLFCLDCDEQVFNEIRQRVHIKGISFTDGCIGTVFDAPHFFRQPICNIKKNEREFSIRLTNFDTDPELLNKRRADDLFIIGDKSYPSIAPQDVNVEKLAVRSFQELKFILGVSNVYE